MVGGIGPVIRELPKRPIPATLELALNFSGDQPGGLPPILDRAVVSFPYGSQLNSRLFPGCAPNTIARRGPGACPAGSKVGSGHVDGVGDTVRQRLRLTLYNGPGGRSIVFHLRGTSPLRIDSAFAAPLRTLRGGRFNYRLTVDVPPSLQRIAGVDVAVEEFVTTVKASRRVGGRRRGYIETALCPPGAQVPLRGAFTFLQGPNVVTDSWIACG